MHLNNRLAAAVVVAGGAVGLLGPGSAGAAVPGSNGVIVMSKCEGGNGECNRSHIWTIDPASGAEHPVTTDAAWWDYDPAVSPDGSRVAFQRCPSVGTCRIAAVDIGGGSVTDLTPGKAYEDYPAFSPDGSKLVFSRHDPAGGTHLVVMDAAGGNEHPLTSGTAFDVEAEWSPDGSTIAFSRRDTGSATRIHTVPASGGSPAPLTAGSADNHPSFSPDGSHIVFEASGAIQIMDSSGGSRHTLTAPGADVHDAEPTFAPDGTQIVFSHGSQTTPYTAPLRVVDADGTDQHPISGPSELLSYPAWQPTHLARATSPASDGSAPAVTLGAPGKESVRKARLYLFATSSEAAAAVAGGKVAIPTLGKRYRLRPTIKPLAADARTKLAVSIPRKRLRAIRTALAGHRKATARIVVRVKDAAGKATTKALTIRLKK